MCKNEAVTFFPLFWMYLQIVMIVRGFASTPLVIVY
jgi:hypothetical protein